MISSEKAGFQKGSEDIEHHHYRDDDTFALVAAIVDVTGKAPFSKNFQLKFRFLKPVNYFEYNVAFCYR